MLWSRHAMSREDREHIKQAAKTAVGIFGDLWLVLRMAAVMLAPMLLAAAIGFVTAAPQRWTEAAVGALLGLLVLGGLSYWAYRPWRRWGRLAKMSLVALQVLTLLAAIAAAASIRGQVRRDQCSGLYGCVSQAVERFLDEASD
jgi:hypothetical protein